MNPSKYITDTELFREVSEARSIKASRAILEACEKKREELRDKVENKPKKRPDDLTQDLVFQLGCIHILNWILDLPDHVKKHIDNIGGE